MTKNPPPAEAEVPEPAPGTTIGQMTPAQRRMVTRRAVAQLQDQLTRMASAIAASLEIDPADPAAPESTPTPAVPPPGLVWEDAGTDEPGDQNATSHIVSHGFWSLGPIGDDRGWGIELVEQTEDLDEIPGRGVHLGYFASDAAAKAAAQQYENEHRSTPDLNCPEPGPAISRQPGYDGGDISGAAKPVEATRLGQHYGWRLPVGNAMETLVRVEAPPVWVRMYIHDTDRPGQHERSAGQLRLTDDVTLYDPARVSEGEIFTVQIEGGSDDGNRWQAVHPAESVVRPWGTDPFDLAHWVRSNQTVADGPNVRIRVWHGLDADTGSEPAAEVDLDAARRRDNHRVRMWAAKFAAETIHQEPPRWLEPTDTNLAAVFAPTVRPVSPGLYPRIREEFLRQAHEPVPFNPGSGVVPGYMAGWCGHRVAASEWAAGFRVCERCPDPRTTASRQTYTYQLRVTPLAGNSEPLGEVVEQETIHVPAGRSPLVVAAELAAATNPKLIGAPDEHWAIVMWPGTEPTGQAAAMYTGADLATDLAADLAEYWRAATEALRHTYDGIDDLEHQLGKLRGVGVRTKRLRKAAARAIKALKQIQEATEAATGDQV